MYQDVPLYTLEDFEQLAPVENRTEQILADEHQLMLNRLNFELAERQRFAFVPFCYHMAYVLTLWRQARPTAKRACAGEGGALEAEQGQTHHDGFREGLHRCTHEG